MLSGEGEGGSGSVVEVEARVLAFIVARRVRFGVLFVVVESCARSCGGLDGGCEAGGGGCGVRTLEMASSASIFCWRRSLLVEARAAS